MATLTNDISATDEDIHVSGDVSAAVPGTDYRIDDEVVTLRDFAKALAGRGARIRSRWIVSRGMVGTAKVTHSASTEIVAVLEAVAVSATIVPPLPFAGEGGVGGSISVSDGTTTVDPTTSLVLPAGTVSDGGAGVAEVASVKDFYAQDTDPGAVGVGSVWKDTSDPVAWYTRNDTDDGWDASFTPFTSSVGAEDAFSTMQAEATGDGEAEAWSYATAAGDGNAKATSVADTNGIGVADASRQANANGDGIAEAGTYASTAGAGAALAPIQATAGGAGDADITLVATTVTGLATTGIKAVRDATETGFLVEVSAAGVAKITALGLPTADPTVAGQLWNDTGTLKVSAG